MAGIFISYRREDSAPYAGRLYDRLSARFGGEGVFMDVDDIQPGANFVSLIEEKIGSCDALVAVIGKGWLSSKDGEGKIRLQDPRDFVRLEVAAALSRKVLVIPALVGGASVPKAHDLPAPLAELAERQAVALTDGDFPRDVDKLIEALEKVPSLKNSEPPANAVQRRRGMRAISWAALLPILVALVVGFWLYQSRHRTGAFAGTWRSEVAYSWGVKSKEQFVLKLDGDKLFGTASFLGYKRGIEDGRVDGERISFVVRFQSTAGSEVTEHRATYSGRISGDKIYFVMQDDQGSLPVEFTAIRDDRQ